MTPLPCVVLGIDAAATSGVAVFVEGRRAWSGVVRKPHERALVISYALAVARSYQLPLMVVAERWPNIGGAHATVRIMKGLGASWGRWQEALEIAGVPKRRVVRVLPVQWRAAVLGLGGRGATTEACRRAAVARAKSVHGVEVDHDEAEANAVAEWGTRAGEVAERIPKRRSKGAP